MRRLIILLFVLVGAATASYAMDGCQQEKLSPAEFRAKQEAFITKNAGLTVEEAKRFFPLYFELQDKKRELNDQMWKLMHQGREGQLAEQRFDEILTEVYDLRIRSSQLEKEYYMKFKGVLSSQKIYNVQRAETHFHRDLVRGVHRNNKGKK